MPWSERAELVTRPGWHPSLDPPHAAGPPFALAITKEMLEKEAAFAFDAAMEAEAQAQAICMRTPEFREGYRAFMEKREPEFPARDGDD